LSLSDAFNNHCSQTEVDDYLSLKWDQNSGFQKAYLDSNKNYLLDDNFEKAFQDDYHKFSQIVDITVNYKLERTVIIFYAYRLPSKKIINPDILLK
jgi:hypothetical protein